MELAGITRENWEQVVLLTTNADRMPTLDEEFVASNAYSLVQAAYEPEWTVRAAVENGVCVGFAMYGWSAELGGPELQRLMIARPYQGRGLGRRLMQLVLQEIEGRFRGDLYLSVVPKNLRAKHLYESFGFRPTGRMDEGEEVWLLSRGEPAEPKGGV